MDQAGQEVGVFSLVPKTFDEAMKYAELISKSSFVPTAYQGKTGDVLIAMQMGAEIGLKPLQALQGIAVINGKPTIYGDVAIALVRNSSVCEYIHETDDGNTARCEAKRKGQAQPVIRTFSDADAKAAGLLDKPGPWKLYRARMRQMRARSFALRDGFADILKGFVITEEAQDYDVVQKIDDTTELVRPKAKAEVVTPTNGTVTSTVVKYVINDDISDFSTAVVDSFEVKKLKKGSAEFFHIISGEDIYVTDLEAVAQVAKDASLAGESLEIRYQTDTNPRIIELISALTKAKA